MPAPVFRHALLVGATGMLADAARWVIARSIHAVVLGRDTAKIGAVTGAAPGSATPGPIDHRDQSALRSLLLTHTDRRGSFDLALVWLHTDAAAALPLIAGACGPEARMVLVCGSASADPSRINTERVRAIARPGLHLQRVTLGFVIEPGGSRWLTDAEISRGTIDALTSGAPDTIVGAVTPWDQRP